MSDVSFREAFKVWARIGLLSFGGPAGQIALMHREIIDERHWLDEKEYLTALNFCMLLPGPEAQQLAIYAGWRLHGIKGGLAAGLLFVIPGAFVVLGLSMLYGAFGQVPLINALFFGIKAAVLAIVVEALLRVARRSLKGKVEWLVAGLAFVALFCFNAPFPAVVIAAALYGFLRGSREPEQHSGELPGLGSIFATASLWLVVWLLPLAALAALLGPEHIFSQIGIFFSKLSVVTFGGAYAVLSYMAQASVEQKHWLSGPEMIDGLGLAETTPGPLILVTEYVGYLAALRATGSIWGGIAGALVTLWMTFAPCFLWVFTGAPYIAAIGKRPRLAGALAMITAAVVGVILNLTIWFGLHVLFGTVERMEGVFKPWLPDFHSLNPWALALSLVAALALLKLHLGLLKTLGICAGLGLVLRLSGVA
ncbi:MAG: chromate efflux transporter [Alphaproteobacteria bacterium]|nr:chromate efflux transporter [Alphaproteobacteria bacterium]